MDNYYFRHTINNNTLVSNLITRVKEIFIQEKVIKIKDDIKSMEAIIIDLKEYIKLKNLDITLKEKYEREDFADDLRIVDDTIFDEVVSKKIGKSLYNYELKLFKDLVSIKKELKLKKGVYNCKLLKIGIAGEYADSEGELYPTAIIEEETTGIIHPLYLEYEGTIKKKY